MRHHQVLLRTLLCTLFGTLALLVGFQGIPRTLSAATSPPATNWPGWRGDGTGISPEKNLPTSWNAKQNIAWKAVLPGEGNSSPIIWGDRIFLTASKDAGKRRLVLCLNAKDGSLRWQQELPLEAAAETYPKTGYAAPTPVTDGERVYAFFDAPGLVALDMDGNLLWTRPLGPFKSTYNMASSPILYKDMVIITCDHDAEGFIAGIDAKTGNVRWKTPRKIGRQYATPLVIDVNGKPQVVVNGTTIIAYNPENGQVLWSCRGMTDCVTPGVLYGQGFVFAASGRNGPAFVIDPRGKGDITETHVRAHITTGGPYVPTPLLYPNLILPGDNGTLKVMDTKGKVLLETRVRDHFTSSPVAAGEKIYWASEKGDVYVLDAGKKLTLKVMAVNRFGEKVLASPAIAGGRLYYRTEKSLYCIAGAAKVKPTVVASTEKATFDELKKRYTEHQQAPEGADVALRLEVVEAMALLKDPQAVPFLQEVAVKDNHWDVSEAAVKALGAYDQAAIPALLAMFKEWRPYLKVVSAQNLGRLQTVDAVPTLVKSAKDGDRMVRVSCLNALTEITLAHTEQAPTTLPVLRAALKDSEGVVREAGVAGVTRLVKLAGTDRQAIIPELLNAAADRNPLVAQQALDALQTYKAPTEMIMRDTLLYGEQRKAPVIADLHAGPVRVKFQDGELRYLYVGQKEIVRRIYFAVRDSRWDTVMPEFSKIDIQQTDTSFKISLSGVCKNDIANYRWSGEIVGTPQGKITFSVNGQADEEFKSPRIGINVLYGSDSLQGQSYELVDADGAATPGVFPREISSQLLSTKFSTLRYATADGLQVSCGVTGATFGMEDQRNFCDSSYKAFSSLAYKYPVVPKGEKQNEAVTLEVKGAKAEVLPTGPITITLGTPIAGRKMPKLLPATATQKTTSFVALNGKRQPFEGATSVAFAYNPAAHMPDDDTYTENITALPDQVRTVRSFNPTAAIRIDPINFDSPYPRPGRDARNGGLFAAAWVAAVAKYCAIAGVDEAVFTVDAGPADEVVRLLSAVAGSAVLDTKITTVEPSPIDVLALQSVAGTTIWIINKTDKPQQAVLQGLPGEKARMSRLNIQTSLKMSTAAEATSAAGALTLDVEPYEVGVITISGQ